MPKDAALSAPPAFVIRHAQEVLQFFFGLLTAKAVALWQLTDKLLDIALDLIDIVVGHLAPPVADISLYLKPFAFENVFIHAFPFPRTAVQLLYQSPEVIRARGCVKSPPFQ